MPAGPSEVEVIADESANPAFIAADFLSQAEHGVDSQAMLVTASESIVEPVMQAIREQLDRLPRKEITEKSLSHSRLIVLKDKQEVIDFTNLYAPEHLIIQTTDYADIAGQVENAVVSSWAPIRRKALATTLPVRTIRCRPTDMQKPTVA